MRDALIAVALGFAGGMASGMLGIGGGALFVPGLVLFLDVAQVRAEATSLMAIVPVAIVGGITSASGELTYYTNVVQLAPHDRIAEYTAAQSLLLGVRGTLAPFAASALLGVLEPRAVLIIGLAFMVTGAFILSGVVREPLRVASAEPVAAPAS